MITSEKEEIQKFIEKVNYLLPPSGTQEIQHFVTKNIKNDQAQLYFTRNKIENVFAKFEEIKFG